MADGRGAEMRWTRWTRWTWRARHVWRHLQLALDWLCSAIALHLDYPPIIAVVTVTVTVTVILFCS